MKIGFIGAGKVGFTLGKYLRDRGADVTGYYSRNPGSAKEAAIFTGTRCFGSLEIILSENDILFLTVPDTAIKPIWDSLKKMPVHGKIICHCSGALSSGVFNGIEERQAFGYSIHPFSAISSKLTSYKTISNAFFTLEGSEKHLHDLKH
ncbi:MAG: NAD(P)-binding domain-containing protein, partial [Defluviitaleaceae bacterium]|nr:NAD(P)-binding domain-containing protein [Defluviitaleaceae bacterium]